MRHDAIDTVVKAAGERFDANRYAQNRTRVMGAEPIELVAEHTLFFGRVIRSMTDGEWAYGRLPVLSHVEEGRAFGCAEPLVTVSRVVARTESFEVEAEHAWGMGAVNQDGNVFGFELLVVWIGGVALA